MLFANKDYKIFFSDYYFNLILVTQVEHQLT